MSPLIRAGIVGLGHMGRNHARVLQSIEGIELVAVADAQGDRFGAASHLTPLPHVEALIAMGIDYCVVALPTALHEEAALLLAEARVNTMVEKPLAPTPDSAERICTAFERAGVLGTVGHIERYNPALRNLRARLGDGELGDIYHISTRRQGPFPVRIADVGVVADLASHDFDLTAWVAHSPFVEISARTAHKSGRRHEDLVAAVGLLENGTVTNHLVNWLSPLKERCTVVLGERGSFVADTLTADLSFHANGTFVNEWDALANFRGVTEGDCVRYALARPEPLRTEHEAMRDAILGQGTDVITMREGLHTIRVMQAASKSAEGSGFEPVPRS
jgi:predicted dehydrogenase